MPTNKICKTVHQYNKDPVPPEDMRKLREIAEDYNRVKNYVYQRYGGINGLSKLYPGYTVQNEMTESGLRTQLGIPSVYFYLANMPYFILQRKDRPERGKRGGTQEKGKGMTTALIFAGGTGKRMNSRSRPKQFLELHGKPIIIYTLEHFEYHDGIDNIAIVCIGEWIRELEGLLKRYDITKTKSIVPGGETGHDSVYCGLKAMKEFAGEDDIVLIHDGVRPLINEELITRNIEAVKKYGSAITCEPVRESMVRSSDGEVIAEIPPRSQMYTAKAPQSFYYGEILRLYEAAHRDGIKSIDSSHLCSLYDKPMHMVHSTKNNMKITEPADYYICRALYDAQENRQIFGW